MRSPAGPPAPEGADAAPDELAASLRAGLAGLGLELDAAAVGKLLGYLGLLEKWNRAYNLTAVRDPAQMVARHLLDSLAVLPFLAGRRVLDIGTGAGLPGIPLAIARPDMEFVLLDSNAKKTRFVTQAAAELSLGNVTVVAERLEHYRPPQGFDTLVARAVGTIADMLDAGRHLLAAGGRFLAMKGVYPQEELAALPAGYQVAGVEAVRVPGLDAARHVVIIVVAA
jgi:16S rRNA (guanine527-N7)-methyltransferase